MSFVFDARCFASECSHRVRVTWGGHSEVGVYGDGAVVLMDFPGAGG